MSSTGEPEAPGAGSAEDQEYFRALEEAFLALRGTTTLLGAEDWWVASGWRRLGIPTELIIGVMEALFARHRERGSKRGISSLRYFRAAVEAAWDERLAHAAGSTGGGEAGPPLRARLDALARALPPDLAAGDALRCSLADLTGDPVAIEEELRRLDRDLLLRLEQSLPESEREQFEARIEVVVRRVAADSPEAERSRLRKRLRAQAVRARFRVPVLSLFAPEALSSPADEAI